MLLFELDHEASGAQEVTWLKLATKGCRIYEFKFELRSTNIRKSMSTTARRGMKWTRTRTLILPDITRLTSPQDLSRFVRPTTSSQRFKPLAKTFAQEKLQGYVQFAILKWLRLQGHLC